ncbi:MAG: hypothetical protein JW963_17995, partial [Anaerolineales bacterium]|nr:hypothetical protein [Anaerolineales bacterium]
MSQAVALFLEYDLSHQNLRAPIGRARICFNRSGVGRDSSARYHQPGTIQQGGALLYFLPKGCAVRLKLAFLTLIFAIVLAACQQQSTATPKVLDVEPSITRLVVPKIDQPTANAIRQNMAMFLKTEPYPEYNAGSQLLRYLVSSGEFG